MKIVTNREQDQKEAEAFLKKYYGPERRVKEKRLTPSNEPWYCNGQPCPPYPGEWDNV